jgi:hypothetical protein
MTKQELKTKFYEALGAVSMCWSETPKGIFESTRAKQIGDDVWAEIENVIAEPQWITLNSEKDLPSENIDCYFIVNKKNHLGYYSEKYTYFHSYKENQEYMSDSVSHYQIINQPKPPHHE